MNRKNLPICFSHGFSSLFQHFNFRIESFPTSNSILHEHLPAQLQVNASQQLSKLFNVECREFKVWIRKSNHTTEVDRNFQVNKSLFKELICSRCESQLVTKYSLFLKMFTKQFTTKLKAETSSPNWFVNRPAMVFSEKFFPHIPRGSILELKPWGIFKNSFVYQLHMRNIQKS